MVNPSEPEFEQAAREIALTLEPLFAKRPDLKRLWDVISIPERVIQFRVVWEDDAGKLQVNNGYRVQFNSALGPYKGGLRFHPTVSLSVLKFLGFEQIFKNALTGQAIGGGKGGADFDPKGKSDNEIRKFCESFMRELSRHIGDNTDIPAGDIGVGGREIGFLFGAYKRYRNEWAGILTGKGMDWGGSHIRPEATGYGVIYFVQNMIARKENVSPAEAFKGRVVSISGSGNVAQYAALKALELGSKVVSLSDSKGLLVFKDGLKKEDVEKIADLKLQHGYLQDIKLDGAEYIAGARPWTKFTNVDIALPCATQNEVDGDDARYLVKNGVKYVAEGSNMGSTLEAIDVFEKARVAGTLWYAPGKAANCGGVAVSALEMAQNSARLQWTPSLVDERLVGIMTNCYNVCVGTAEDYAAKGELPSLVAGANLAGFLKVAQAMKAHGDFW